MEKYFLNILREQKGSIKMNNQTDDSFDLILLTSKSYNQVMNKLNFLMKREITTNIAWEFKSRKNHFKLYRDISITKIKDNFNPFKNRVEGKVVSCSCNDVSYYGIDVDKLVPKTNKKYKDSKLLFRAMKLSNLDFNFDN